MNIENVDNFPLKKKKKNRKNQLNAIMQTCQIFLQFPNCGVFRFPQNQSIYEYITNMAPNIEDVIPNSIGMDNIIRNLYVKPIFTKLGLCFTFNSLNSNEIYSDK